MPAEHAKVPVWGLTLAVGLATTLAGATVTTAYRAGAIAEGLERLAGAVEKVDRRMASIEAQQALLVNRVTVLETRASLAATSSASAHSASK